MGLRNFFETGNPQRLMHSYICHCRTAQRGSLGGSDYCKASACDGWSKNCSEIV